MPVRFAAVAAASPDDDLARQIQLADHAEDEREQHGYAGSARVALEDNDVGLVGESCGSHERVEKKGCWNAGTLSWYPMRCFKNTNAA